ncbi:hypothetical protein IQ278_12055 [Tolypothrix sp. LEGE 11397]|uniref:hypothetical protein n=1 Tax=Tolypothrix sp. LEGE 11397 TaxID=2777971 RepID=UPI00187FE3C3|nr:hypothetical protein [Tolypothrix sp. LEGE 11397]MBE9082847.1 hypothetical protein [Tolypothrix sp. LEGE 11397]
MKYEARSFGELVRKVAIDYVRYGYYRYLVIEIPKAKDPKLIDEKILSTYRITYHRTTRARLKAQGEAIVVMVRYGHRFVLLATEGTHTELEKRQCLDCRVTPIHLSGYTVGVKHGKPHVQMSLKRYRGIKKLLIQTALHNENKLRDFFGRISPFKFPGILRQQRKLLNEVNQRRKRAGLTRINLNHSQKK